MQECAFVDINLILDVVKKQKTHQLGIQDDGSLTRSTGVEVAGTGSPNTVDRWLARTILRVIGAPRIEFVLWDGEPVRVVQGPVVGRLLFHDRRALWAVARSPSMGFGDAYSSGRIEVDGELFDVLVETFKGLMSVRDGRMQKLLKIWPTATRTGGNTLRRAKENIHHHYDLGNEFYRLWLDERMVYTCAYYEQPDFTIEQAQLAKMHHVSRKLALEPGQSVIEAGCGWGSLALHMAEHYGVRVRAFNISAEQVKYARGQAAARGLSERVEFIEDDYRNVTGTADVFVSVGMLEHVGIERFRDLGSVVDRCLARHGRGLIHTIGRTRPTPNNVWMERRIFPGSYAPCLSEMTDIFEPYDISVLDVENLRLHYRNTCLAWLERFEDVAANVTRTYDESFVRAWRLYLAGAAASFDVGNLQLYQVLFAPYGNNDVPWTRHYQYLPRADAHT